MKSGSVSSVNGDAVAGEVAGAVAKPMDGGTYLLAAERTARCRLDHGSALGRDRVGLAPLVDGLQRDAAVGDECGTQCSRRLEVGLNGLVAHDAIKPQVLSNCKPWVALPEHHHAPNLQPMVTKQEFDGGAALHALLTRAKRQRLELAHHLGVSEQAVQKWLKGGGIAHEHMAKLCRYLDCSADELLGLRPIDEIGGSHSMRLDRDIVEGVALALQDTVKELRAVPSITSIIDVFARTYDRIGASGITTADVVWMVKQLEQGEVRDAKAGDLSDGSRDAAGRMGSGNRKT